VENARRRQRPAEGRQAFTPGPRLPDKKFVKPDNGKFRRLARRAALRAESGAVRTDGKNVQVLPA
jgi:hypothetical protein